VRSPPELTTLHELKAGEPDYFFSDRHRESWWQPLRALIQSGFESQVEQSDGDVRLPVVVVKEPGSHVAPLLTDLFPASKMIFLLRDGRDVVDSWLDAHSQGSWAISGGAFPVSAEGRIPLIRWLAAVWAYRSRAVRQAFETRQADSGLWSATRTCAGPPLRRSIASAPASGWIEATCLRSPTTTSPNRSSASPSGGLSSASPAHGSIP
jgi:hypothetical protein